MAQSSKSKPRSKPEKPRPDFPLFPHAVGMWAKKVRGRMRYFGPWDDPQGALKKWLDQKEDLLAGRDPVERKPGLTLRELVNRFRSAKEDQMIAGELNPRTYGSYVQSCDRLIAAFSRNRLVEEIKPDDFAKLRLTLSRKKDGSPRSPASLRGDVLNIRMIFQFGIDRELLKTKPRYGNAFDVPDRATLRRARQAKGKRMFEAEELRHVIQEADQPLRAMLLLGINCGLGATDLAHMPQSAIDLKRAWLDYPRVKTAVDRRCPLWTETAKAVQEAIASRPDPRDPADLGLVFLTRCGQRWVRSSSTGGAIDAVACETNKLLKRLGLHRPGLGHYALRHTLQTIGGAMRDQVAMNLIFGHVDGSMAGAYREHIEDEERRLLAIVNHVRSWVFPAKRKPR